MKQHNLTYLINRFHFTAYSHSMSFLLILLFPLSVSNTIPLLASITTQFLSLFFFGSYYAANYIYCSFCDDLIKRKLSLFHFFIININMVYLIAILFLLKSVRMRPKMKLWSNSTSLQHMHYVEWTI
jgi:hypothetical protein